MLTRTIIVGVLALNSSTIALSEESLVIEVTAQVAAQDVEIDTLLLSITNPEIVSSEPGLVLSKRFSFNVDDYEPKIISEFRIISYSVNPSEGTEISTYKLGHKLTVTDVSHDRFHINFEYLEQDIHMPDTTVNIDGSHTPNYLLRSFDETVELDAGESTSGRTKGMYFTIRRLGH